MIKRKQHLKPWNNLSTFKYVYYPYAENDKSGLKRKKSKET